MMSGTGRGLAERQTVDHLRAGEPAVLLDTP